MAASRRGQPELHVRLPPSSPSTGAGLTTGTSLAATQQLDLPPVSAVFLIEFDVKAGYTLTWKAAQPGIELEGTVEYKSLPSGAHTVTDDLIYFVHEGYAGLSAFVNAPIQDTESRNARMLAVGVLVPLSYGRLGRAWRHAEGLKEMASKIVVSGKEVSILEQYWEKNRARDESTEQDPQASRESLDSPSVTFQDQPKPPKKQKPITRNRSASDGTGLLAPGHKLSPFHPAWSLTALLDTLGPLIFPIHRAALLRKRILISCHAPVQEICNFVYNISILSNIPLPTYEILPQEGPSHRLRPLFNICVHDIPFLVEDAKSKRSDDETADHEPGLGSGWIACTTDSILALKDTLWDMLITMPPPHASAGQARAWPTVEYPKGVPIKATQRDLRRYKALRNGLFRKQSSNNVAAESPDSPTPSVLTNPQKQTQDDPILDEAEKIVEPLSWAALAYNGFMWWASAGEQARADEAEESSNDASLLADVTHPNMSMHMSSSIGSMRRTSSIGGLGGPFPTDEARTELAIITYFHRLTSQLLTKMADIVESSGDDEEEPSNEDDDAMLPDESREDYDRGIGINPEDIKSMGLDRWSKGDADFVHELADVYFGRPAYMEGKPVEVCGVRVC